MDAATSFVNTLHFAGGGGFYVYREPMMCLMYKLLWLCYIAGAKLVPINSSSSMYREEGVEVYDVRNFIPLLHPTTRRPRSTVDWPGYSRLKRQAGIPCARNCMQLVWWVGQLRTTLGIGGDAKKEGLRKRVHAHPGRAGRPSCA